jgi:hypothetical protein
MIQTFLPFFSSFPRKRESSFFAEIQEKLDARVRGHDVPRIRSGH